MIKNFAVASVFALIGMCWVAASAWASSQKFETTSTPLALGKGVHVQKVTFPNKAITVVGNLFTPADYDSSKKYAAIVITHPGGGVKEQTAGLYAERLAQKGFITLAYDASYQGESGGEPRFIEDPATRVEDIRSATDFLSNHPAVKSVGALGICAGGGYTVHAAQTEARIKAVATISAVDSGRTRREGIGGTMTDESRNKVLEEVGRQRTI
ncbi:MULTISPECIES: alpha/beta hydrolase [unclassified Desulfovibrio]|uniref:alpha/beta hydrolase n=1 Tax=unclassified Desulfovibrio TaxID=2593640 RepID=UPI002FD91A1E